MHELGVVIEIIKTVEDFALKNGLTKVDTIILQVGELSSMIPQFLRDCYPAAVDGTAMENTKLEIEILPGNALCGRCSKVFNIIRNKSVCPHCSSREWEIISGKEFMIKEIVAC